MGEVTGFWVPECIRKIWESLQILVHESWEDGATDQLQSATLPLLLAMRFARAHRTNVSYFTLEQQPTDNLLQLDNAILGVSRVFGDPVFQGSLSQAAINAVSDSEQDAEPSWNDVLWLIGRITLGRFGEGPSC